MISIEDVKKILQDNSIYMGKQRGHFDTISVMLRCPYCGDSKKSQYKCHMQIKNRKYKGKDGVWFRCAKCSEGGHVFTLFEKLGINFDARKYRAAEISNMFRNFKRPDMFAFKKAFQIKDTTIPTLDTFKIQRQLKIKGINEITKESVKYLIFERKYDKDYIQSLISKSIITICDDYDIQFDKDLAPLYERIVFFSFNHVLVQGRKINDFGKRYHIYRKSDEFTDIIYFEGIGPMVFLTEGPFDSMRINSYGYHSISLQGKNSGNLIESFQNFSKTRRMLNPFKFLIFCFDKDVPYEELEIHSHKLWKSGIINNQQQIGYLKMYDTDYKDIDNVEDEDTFDTLVKTKVSLFSPLDRIKNIFKSFIGG